MDYRVSLRACHVLKSVGEVVWRGDFYCRWFHVSTFESFVAVRSVVMVVVRIVAIETRGKRDEMGIFACFRVYFLELEQQQTFFWRPDSKLYRTFATENRKEIL